MAGGATQRASYCRQPPIESDQNGLSSYTNQMVACDLCDELIIREAA